MGFPKSWTAIRRRATTFASRLMALLSIMGHWLPAAKSHFGAVAQMVGFGLGRSEMLYISMEVD
ncbi:hypothetical protein AC629_32350 [Bradyrhizobium sp. NAS80.1]|nr:hypothetical protein AC629_32350 [Bradyrhizobium sp. NAS80.1]